MLFWRLSIVPCVLGSLSSLAGRNINDSQLFCAPRIALPAPSQWLLLLSWYFPQTHALIIAQLKTSGDPLWYWSSFSLQLSSLRCSAPWGPAALAWLYSKLCLLNSGRSPNSAGFPFPVQWPKNSPGSKLGRSSDSPQPHQFSEMSVLHCLFSNVWKFVS